MTHSEMTKAAERVVENLGLLGGVCASADSWSSRHGKSPRYRRVEWRICFVPENSTGADVLQEKGINPESVLLCWTERMRLKYGPKHEPSEAELAATLDAHRVAESAA